MSKRKRRTFEEFGLEAMLLVFVAAIYMISFFNRIANFFRSKTKKQSMLFPHR